MKRRCAFLLLVVVMSIGSAGCGSDPPVTVKGTVTLGGAPLDNGTISFVPQAAGQNNAGWAMVKQGEYSIPAGSGLAVGDYRVEIRAMKSTGPLPVGDELPVPAKELVPVRYNSKSELTAKLQSGENTANFELKSK